MKMRMIEINIIFEYINKDLYQACNSIEMEFDGIEKNILEVYNIKELKFY